MAEERNVGTARAPETFGGDEESTKAELQRRMEEARESITQTVSEIKDTVATQYQSVREALDWREQFRRRPVAFSVGALTVGFFVGYGIASVIKEDREEKDYNVFDISDDGEYNPNRSAAAYAPRAYAAGAITGGPALRSAPSPAAEATFGGNHESFGSAPDEPAKPGLMERFKETRAFDRLQQEVSSLGDRLLDEISHTAQAVVLPALLGKVKDMIGVDLSTQQREAKRSALEKQTISSRTDAAEKAGQSSGV